MFSLLFKSSLEQIKQRHQSALDLLTFKLDRAIQDLRDRDVLHQCEIAQVRANDQELMERQRQAFEELIAHLKQQVSELNAERRHLLDQLLVKQNVDPVHPPEVRRPVQLEDDQRSARSVLDEVYEQDNILQELEAMFPTLRGMPVETIKAMYPTQWAAAQQRNADLTEPLTFRP